MNIEPVLSILARACVSKGVEAVACLSLRIMQVVSTLHTVIYDLYRGIQDQKRLEDELWVAINGPEVVHCDSIVRVVNCPTRQSLLLSIGSLH